MRRRLSTSTSASASASAGLIGLHHGHQDGVGGGIVGGFGGGRGCGKETGVGGGLLHWGHEWEGLGTGGQGRRGSLRFPTDRFVRPRDGHDLVNVVRFGAQDEHLRVGTGCGGR